jgi:hypothetical protein
MENVAEEMHQLVERYCAGDISAEEYFAEVDNIAVRAINAADCMTTALTTNAAAEEAS